MPITLPKGYTINPTTLMPQPTVQAQEQHALAAGVLAAHRGATSVRLPSPPAGILAEAQAEATLIADTIGGAAGEAAAAAARDSSSRAMLGLGVVVVALLILTW